MGYGEFGGGGSVDWEIVHGNGNNGSGHKHGGKGKDDDPPKGSKGVFTIEVYGGGPVQNLGPYDLDTSRIVLRWGPRMPVTPTPARMPGKKTATVSKKRK